MPVEGSRRRRRKWYVRPLQARRRRLWSRRGGRPCCQASRGARTQRDVEGRRNAKPAGEAAWATKPSGSETEETTRTMSTLEHRPQTGDAQMKASQGSPWVSPDEADNACAPSVHFSSRHPSFALDPPLGPSLSESVSPHRPSCRAYLSLPSGGSEKLAVHVALSTQSHSCVRTPCCARVFTPSSSSLRNSESTRGPLTAASCPFVGASSADASWSSCSVSCRSLARRTCLSSGARCPFGRRRPRLQLLQVPLLALLACLSLSSAWAASPLSSSVAASLSRTHPLRQASGGLDLPREPSRCAPWPPPSSVSFSSSLRKCVQHFTGEECLFSLLSPGRSSALATHLLEESSTKGQRETFRILRLLGAVKKRPAFGPPGFLARGANAPRSSFLASASAPSSSSSPLFASHVALCRCQGAGAAACASLAWPRPATSHPAVFAGPPSSLSAARASLSSASPASCGLLSPLFPPAAPAPPSSSVCFAAPFLSPTQSPSATAPLPSAPFQLADEEEVCDEPHRGHQRGSQRPGAAGASSSVFAASAEFAPTTVSHLDIQQASVDKKPPTNCASPGDPTAAFAFERRSVPPWLPRRGPRPAREGVAKGEAEEAHNQGNAAVQDLLSSVNLPVDLKKLPLHLLPQLCGEIRQEILSVVSHTGGHLASSLGMVEVIVALLRVLDVPSDRIVYDVSHQAYPHKILTGRRHLMGSLRQQGGISGFCKRAESVYDAFGAGHSSTSISSIQGMAVAREHLARFNGRREDKPLHVAVIGDGGLTGGMAYEALNACGYLKSKILVILNDNQQVSLPTGVASAGGTAPASAVSRHTQELLKVRDFWSLKSFFRMGMNSTFFSETWRLSSLLQLLDRTKAPDAGASQAPSAQDREKASAGRGGDAVFDLERLRRGGKTIKGDGAEAGVTAERGECGGREREIKEQGTLARDLEEDDEESDQPKAHVEASFFEALGFDYLGPVDGHDVENLVAVLSAIKQTGLKGPTLLHVKTEKGHGYPPALAAADRLHGVSAGFSDLFHKTPEKQQEAAAPKSSASESPAKKSPFLTSVAARALLRLAEDDRNVVGITAAMPGGTGLHVLGARFPERMFDVGIAEQHAVTFAAGMAAEGLKPFCAIYSTFLQRAYDQIIHDAALQKLPVRFLIDRAGYVGPDGSTHQGSFDLAYLGCVPNLVVMAPSDELELIHMMETAYRYDDGPSAIRYGRAPAYGMETLNTYLGHAGVKELPERGAALEIGRGRIVREAHPAAKHKVAILSLGTRLLDAVHAALLVEEACSPAHPRQTSSTAAQAAAKGDANSPRNQTEVGVTVADARFLAPLDRRLLRTLAKTHSALLIVEEGAVGGFGAQVLKALTDDGLLDSAELKVRSLTMPHSFMEAGTLQQQYEEAGLTAKHFAGALRSLVRSVSSPAPSLQSSSSPAA
ncbi:1-deoxy-D-xylulose-5-phosphate synthase [Besnoitia besnoiti]|uniref:1-deoxy-D-xylulose-5-phosphate synthase n=1 Tax=Besnoitia besnoiti TaxID=94643 RepID=A0A2A9M683_BESBE|nr:1-deoxy-D-xylulose-5-phosphate synthase [Besnoitia besnoiti]PFH31821.1 1-deoxy-D-xylulose-5-phosphate synthase [Besnoitia besnoiti]